MFRKLLADKALYKRFLLIAIPIIIQNGITNFVSLLDNIMVGQVGSIQMSGVSIVNGLIFVFNLCIFGASSGAGIFTAQFYGSSDHEGVRYTFRFKLLMCIALSVLGISAFCAAGTPLINLSYDQLGTYRPVLMAVAALPVILLICYQWIIPYMKTIRKRESQ